MDNSSNSNETGKLSGEEMFIEIVRHHIKLKSGKMQNNDLVTLLELVKKVHQNRKNYTIGDRDRFSAAAGDCASYLENLNNFADAEKIYKMALDIYDHGGVHLQYADFLVDQDRLAEAEKHIELGERINPNDRRLARLNLKLEVKQGSGSDVREFSKAKKSGSFSGGELVISVTRHLMMLKSGKTQDGFGDPATLLALVRETRETRDSYGDEDLENFSGMAGNCALELEKRERFVQAEEIYKMALDIYDHGGVRLQYADFLVDQKRFGEAEKQIEKGEIIVPTHPQLALLKLKLEVKRHLGLDGQPTTDQPRNKVELPVELSEDGLQFSDVLHMMALGATEENGTLKPREKMSRFLIEWNAWWQEVHEQELLKREEASLQILADFLADIQKDRLSVRELAQALYLILLKKYGEFMDVADKAAVQHNLAILFTLNEEGELALALWSDAYLKLQEDMNLRLPLAKHLFSLNRDELAVRILDGKGVEWNKEESVRDLLDQGRQKLKDLMDQVGSVEDILEKVRNGVKG